MSYHVFHNGKYLGQRAGKPTTYPTDIPHNAFLLDHDDRWFVACRLRHIHYLDRRDTADIPAVYRTLALLLK
jgi:hypothetical protein